LDDYLTLRRGLGYKLEEAQKLLSDFVSYLERHNSSFVTTKLSLEWATLTPTVASLNRKSTRLSVVRGFAKYLRAFDARTEVTSQELLPRCSKRVPPNLYSDKDIVELLKAAKQLCTPVQAGTYSTLIGLLAVTGMRIGEAIALNRTDIDWDNKLLVGESKFGKSRELLLHPTTLDALRAYAKIRDQAFANLPTPSFFVSLRGERLIYSNVRKSFVWAL
jgi:integrase